MRKGPGRPKKNKDERSKNAGLCAYPSEISAIKKISRQLSYATPFDYVRALVIQTAHPLAKKIHEPAFK